jgi:response regulator NasT
MSEEHLRIAVADDERDIREYLQEVLPRLGHQVVVAAADGRQLVEAARLARPDLVITDIKMPGLDGIEAALALNQAGPVPVVLLSAHDDEELVRRASTEGVLAYLVKPISEADLKTTIPVAMQRFRQSRALAEEAAGLRQALEDRKLIERAKGVVMKRLRIEEEDAFRRLRMLASNQNRKLIDVCRQVTASEEVFHQLEAALPRGA